ncbi:MAG: DUF2007 domain-containing protein [Verrucomicrobia bacterium]|nr:DUF2007 domain-containing protein [Verrucomicrobiota bacterium]
MNLVTVFSSFNQMEAHLIRSRLEASDFHAVVNHELAALTMDGYSMAAGGILVQVPESEAAAAKELIAAANSPEE